MHRQASVTDDEINVAVVIEIPRCGAEGKQRDSSPRTVFKKKSLRLSLGTHMIDEDT